MNRRIVVIGDVVLDVVVRPLTDVAPTSDTPARVRVGRGGAGANLAVALRAAVGTAHEVTFVGVGADDAAARIVRTDLDAAGVRTHIATVPGATGVVVSLVAPSGERAMMTERGVNSQLDFTHVARMFDDPLGHLHVSGYIALDDHTRALMPRLIAAAHGAGATSSIDVCSVGPLRRVGPAAFREVARAATMLFANEEEALTLSGEGDVETALAALARDWREVVVTRGPRGALARRGHEIATATARADHVVDTTGAGDSATGTYLAHRLTGADLATSLGHAMDAAARVVRGLGSRG
ncbi:MAG: hypothetical protein HIU57_09195 [Acidobacteria bacterium]|nr:hypothetical protein [Acidobacteriota bacterium]